MLRAGPPLLHFRVSLSTQPLPRPTGHIRDAYTGAVQAYLTFSLALEVDPPTFKAREKRLVLKHGTPECRNAGTPEY